MVVITIYVIIIIIVIAVTDVVSNILLVSTSGAPLVSTNALAAP